MAKAEDSLVVRRYLASKLQTLPFGQRWEIARGLIGHNRSQWDRNIPYLTWYGIAPLVEAEPEKALTLVNQTSWPMLKDFITKACCCFPGRTIRDHHITLKRSESEGVRRARKPVAHRIVKPASGREAWWLGKGKSQGEIVWEEP